MGVATVAGTIFRGRIGILLNCNAATFGLVLLVFLRDC